MQKCTTLAVLNSCTTLAVLKRCTTQAVLKRCTTLAVLKRCTTLAVLNRCTTQSVLKRCTTLAVPLSVDSHPLFIVPRKCVERSAVENRQGAVLLLLRKGKRTRAQCYELCYSFE